MMLLVAGGTAAAIKLTQKDAQKIEEHTGYPPDQLSEEELTQAMRDLGIQSIELTDEDKAVIAKQSDTAVAPTASLAPTGAPSAASDDSYIAELEQLADLRDRGIITDEEFEAKKRKLLGL